MLAEKKIDFGTGVVFASIAEARDYYGQILRDTPIDQRVTNEEYKAVRLLYEAYCAKTNWPLPSSPKAFFTTHKRGVGYTTKCFGVEFEDGSKATFSLDKALAAVAN